MSHFFVSPLASRRSGKVFRPANTSELAAIGSPPAGSTILLKSGVTYAGNAMPIIAADKVTLGASGTGSKPILSGSVAEAAWTYDATNNVYYHVYGGSNVGIPTEDGVPMKFVGWPAGATLATIAAQMVSGSSAGKWAGSAAFNPATNTLYIRPSSGAASSHTYAVSTASGQVFGEGLSLTGTSTQSILDTRVDGISFRHLTRHGIFAYWVTGLRVTNCDTLIIGPWYPSTDINVIHGNGIELGHGCVDCVVDGLLAEDIFDSVVTVQTGASVQYPSYHCNFLSVTGRRHGMHLAEFSIFGANQLIRDCLVQDAVSQDQGVGFSGQRNGGGLNIYNDNFPASSQITRVFGHNIQCGAIHRLYLGASHRGVCGIQESSASSVSQGFNGSQYSGQGTDYYRAVSDGLGPWGTMAPYAGDLRALLT